MLPVFILILAGFIFRRSGFPGDSFWGLADRLTYYGLLPSLLFGHLAGADFQGLEVPAMAAALVLAVLLVSGSVLALRSVIRAHTPRFTSVFQGSIRPNSYIGLATNAGLYPEQGLALTAVAIAAVIPLVNLLSVVVLTHYLSAQRVNFGSFVRSVLQNPLIVACAMGLLLNVGGLTLPHSLEATLDLFGRAALPLGLLSVGAGLRPRLLVSSPACMLIAGSVKLLAFPLVTALLCLMLNVTGPAMAVAVLYAALPASGSSYILATQMGGDAEMMAGIITVETLVSMATLPLWLILLT